jgi:hypothetical protein
VEKKQNESSKIFADFTLSRIQPEIRQSFTDVQLIELRRVLIDQVESSHHSLDIRFTFRILFQSYYFVILSGKDRRKKTLDSNNSRKEKTTEKLLSIAVTGIITLGIVYSAYSLLVLLYQIKKEMGIDLIENMHIEDAIKKIIEMVI